jgi:hypothetical protein
VALSKLALLFRPETGSEEGLDEKFVWLTGASYGTGSWDVVVGLDFE